MCVCVRVCGRTCGHFGVCVLAMCVGVRICLYFICILLLNKAVVIVPMMVEVYAPCIPASIHCRTEAVVLVVLTTCVHPLTIIFMLAATLLDHFSSFRKCLKSLPFKGPHWLLRAPPLLRYGTRLPSCVVRTPT